MTSPAQELSAFLDEALPAFEQQWGDDRGFEARLDWQRRLHAGGWVAPSWPVEIGGRGLGVADRVACDLVLAERKAPTIAGILGVNNVGPTLAAWGTDEQKAHLPKILAGDEIWCQGFSEPEAGSDLAGLRMSAIRDGDEFVVNGQKIWTSQGMQADFAEVFFEDVRVPVTNLLGPENDGWRVTMTTLSHERAGVITMSAILESDVRRLIDDHSRDGDRPLSPALRDEVVQRYIEARVLGVMGQNSLALAEAGGRPGPEQSVIKLSWSLLSQRMTETRLAVEGLPAMAGAVPSAANSFLGARASTIAGGTTEVMKNILAERVLGLPKDPS